jgi:hypothetical protein
MMILVKFYYWSPSPFKGEGWDGGDQINIKKFYHPLPNPPPFRGRETSSHIRVKIKIQSDVVPHLKSFCRFTLFMYHRVDENVKKSIEFCHFDPHITF